MGEPSVLSMEVAGEIMAVGPGVNEWAEVRNFSPAVAT